MHGGGDAIADVGGRRAQLFLRELVDLRGWGAIFGVHPISVRLIYVLCPCLGLYDS